MVRLIDYHRESKAESPSMLVNCVVYQDGRKLADIPIEDISEYVGRPECFVWVALVDSSPEELDHMGTDFGLHPLAVKDAKTGHRRPKIEEYEDSLFAVLQTVDYKLDADAELSVGEVVIFAGKNYILSTRSNTEKGFVEIRARAEREPEQLRHGSGYALYALMDAIVDRYFPVLDGLESELEEIEKKIFTNNAARSNIEALYELKQKLITLKHAVDPLSAATGKLYGGRVPPLCMGLQEYFADVYNHLHRIHDSIDGIQEMIATAIQVNLGMISVNENENVKKLASWAAIIGVPTAIAGVYGMNFKYMPELDWIWGYPFALGLMVGVDVVLYFWFRRIGWL